MAFAYPALTPRRDLGQRKSQLQLAVVFFTVRELHQRGYKTQGGVYPGTALRFLPEPTARWPKPGPCPLASLTGRGERKRQGFPRGLCLPLLDSTQQTGANAEVPLSLYYCGLAFRAFSHTHVKNKYNHTSHVCSSSGRSLSGLWLILVFS